jgi:hypothetical protein
MSQVLGTSQLFRAGLCDHDYPVFLVTPYFMCGLVCAASKVFLVCGRISAGDSRVAVCCSGLVGLGGDCVAAMVGWFVQPAGLLHMSTT